MYGLPALDDLQSEVDSFVEELFESYIPRRHPEGKILRDAVFGYLWFEPHEIAIIDSPLVQRLRQVHQTAFAHYVYPSARHSRFEHSLGVAILAGNMAKALNRVGNAVEVSDTQLRTVRLAGLLHDCGHGLYSHLSESIMAERFSSTVDAVRVSGHFKNKANVKLGELLSYLMIRSSPFRKFWDELVGFYPNASDIELETVAALIVGETEPEIQFLSDIITGPFDADKLDYFRRDSHFTGIKAELDIDRLLYTLDTYQESSPGTPRRLVMRRGSVPHLEQILFSKMMLFSSIYHHHKVRAVECMVRAIFEQIWDDQSAVNNPRLQFRKVTDYLRVSEMEFVVLAMQEGALRPQVLNLLRRNVLQRCLFFDSASMRKHGEIDAIRRFQKLAETANSETIRKIRGAIFNSLPSQFRTSVYDLWIDLPSNPPLSADAEQCHILMPGNRTVTLHTLFPSDEWVAAYGDNKWAGHIFYVPIEDHRREVARVATEVLEGLFQGIKIPEDATQNCFK